MENQTHQPQPPYPPEQTHPQQQYPQQPYSPVPNQAQPTYHNQPTHQPQQQQPHQTQQTYPPTTQKKKQGFSIASFILSGIVYLPTFIILFAASGDYGYDTGMGLAILLFIFVFLCTPVNILISSILAITGLIVNKTKSSIIALLVALLPAALIYIIWAAL